jgi:Na+-driven multidrug efflux pump
MSNEEHIQNDSLIKVILKLLTIITVLITSVIIVLIFAVFQPNILSWFKKSDETHSE